MSSRSRVLTTQPGPMTSNDVPAIELRKLTKRFGTLRALDGIDMRVEQGSVFGYLGPNGSGKTTTIRLMLALLFPTEGDAYLLGERVEPGAPVLGQVGALVERPAFYPYLSAMENLHLFAVARGLGRHPARDSEEALALLGLSALRDRRVGGFSTGMRQRLGIALAILGRPRLIILDEPTSGLDPEGVVEVRQIIGGLAARGSTVFLSTHQLHEAEQLCSHVAVLSNGRLLAVGSTQELAGGGQETELRFRSEADKTIAAARLRAESLTVTDIAPDSCSIQGAHGGDRLIALAASAGVHPTEVISKRAGLEAAYLLLLRNREGGSQ